MDRPTHALLILTYRCNLRCPYCLVFNPVRYWRPDPAVALPHAVAAQEMTTAQLVERVIPQCEAAGIEVLALTGGEVLVRKDAPEIFRALGRSRLKWCIDSNLSFCTDAVANTIVEAECDTVFVSVDGPAEVHNRLRGSRVAWRGVSEGLATLARARGQGSGPRPSLVLNCVLQPGNESGAPGLIRIAAEYGADAVSFQLLSKLYYDPEEEEFDAVAAARALAEARLLAREIGVRMSVFPVADPSADEMSAWFSSPPAFAFFSGCSYIHSSLRIDPAGNVIPCIEHQVGNVLEEELLDIWRGDAYQAFRRQVHAAPLQACHRCCNMTARDASQARLWPQPA